MVRTIIILTKSIKFFTCMYAVTLNLIQFFNLEAKGVPVVTEPTSGIKAFHVSQPFTIPADDHNWINMANYLPNSVYLIQLDTSYVGNIFLWSSQSNSTNVKVDIENNTRNGRTLKVQLLNRLPLSFILPNSSMNFQTIGLRVAYGCTVTVFADCYKVMSIDLKDLIYGANTTAWISIFRSASSSNIAKVELENTNNNSQFVGI